MKRFFFFLLSTSGIFSLNAQTVKFSADNSFAGRVVGENIVFNFNFEDGESYSTFFFEKDGKNIFLSGTQIGDSLILHSENDPSALGTFRLKFVSNNTSAIGTWESNGTVKDVTVHKTDAKEWSQKINKKIAEAIVSIDPNFTFTQQNIMKLNMLKMIDAPSDNGVFWKKEQLSGVEFPTSADKKLTSKLEGLHYIYALRKLDSYKGTNVGELVSQPKISKIKGVTSLSVDVYDETGFGKTKYYQHSYVFDNKSGKVLHLRDLIKSDGELHTTVFNLLKAAYPEKLNSPNECNWGDLIEMGIYSWRLDQDGIHILINPKKPCEVEFLISIDKLTL